MPNALLEIPQEQAERILAVAQMAHMQVHDVVDLMLRVVSLIDPGKMLDLQKTAWSAGMLVAARQFVDVLEHRDSPRYTSEQFMRDLAEANRSGDAETVTAVRAKGRAASVGFNSNAGRPAVVGIAYQNELRDAW